MIVLGINSNHANASACFVENGKVLFAIEEERLNRIKNSSGFPKLAINAGLDFLNLNIGEIKHVAINSNPKAAVIEKIKFSLKNIDQVNKTFKKFKDSFKKYNIQRELLNISYDKKFVGKIYNVEHHLSHIASAHFLSGFSESVGISVDGSGDFTTTASSFCSLNNIDVKKRVYYPNSLGIFYTAFTKYLGFSNYGDEYKVMGLAPYGSKKLVTKLSEVISIDKKGEFSLNFKYFNHNKNMNFIHVKENKILINNLLNNNLISDLINIPPRNREDEVLSGHKDLAFAIQFLYEKAFFNFLNYSYEHSKSKNLSLAGGCANNSSANGKIRTNTKFENIFIQPASTDAGGALGAALMIDKKINENQNISKMTNVYLGNSYSEKEVEASLDLNTNKLEHNNVEILKGKNEKILIKNICNLIIEKKIVAIFRDRIEWGSRSLGNRSIIGDPRLKNMKEILNKKIKIRESFRPFAPSILNEYVSDWFESDLNEVPHMMEVKKVKVSKRKLIPAVTHIDGTGRLQTVKKDQNSFFYDLIQKFYEVTSVPILLNTSFNENEPIVLTPEQAISTFLRTDIDALLLQNILLIKK